MAPSKSRILNRRDKIFSPIGFFLSCLGILLVAFVLYKIAPILFIISIAVLLATTMEPLVNYVQGMKKKWLPRSLTVVLVVILALLLLFFLLGILVFNAVNEGIKLFQDETIKEKINLWFTHFVVNRFPQTFNAENVKSWLSAESSNIGKYIWSTTQAVFGFLGIVASLGLACVLSVFFSVFKEGILKNIIRLIPPANQEKVGSIANNIASRVGGWLRGQIILAIIITCIIWPVMLALQVEYPGVIAVVGGLGELIPMVGPVAAFVPAIIIVLTMGYPLWKIITVVLFFILLTQVENYFIAPRVMSKSVGLAPISIIISVLIGASLLGIFGAILAIPTAAIIHVIFEEVVFPYIKKMKSGNRNGN
jgi:predicted PurR-regulated permease PerM